jgi:FkbM family methyltransferase
LISIGKSRVNPPLFAATAFLALTAFSKTGASIKLLRSLLACAPLRRRLALALRLSYFSDLELSLPLSHGLHCPIFREDDNYSLAEIFVNDIYAELPASGPLPARWIDLGCHAGYFSLWLEWRRRRQGLPAGGSSALLVDADARRSPGLSRLIALNHLGSSWQFTQGAIAAGHGSKTFFERGVMASSTTPNTQDPGTAVTVPILNPERLRQLFPPPYDLIKVDVEGAETDFLAHYEPVWRDARQILLEWHASALGPAGVEGLRSRLRAGGFSRVLDFGPKDEVGSGHLLASRV